MSAHMHSRRIPAYVAEVRKHFKEAYAEAHLQSTVQLMPGDIVLMMLDMFQGKRKVKDQWSKAEYVVVQQVTDDVPA